jgi:hypothetical protein
LNQRRLLVLALGCYLAGHAALLRAQTSTASMRRVGVLVPSTHAKEAITLQPFFDRMHELGCGRAHRGHDWACADDQQEAASLPPSWWRANPS